MIFVDTSAWYADAVADDPDHEAARDFRATNTDRLVTTDYVIDELLTLLRARGRGKKVQRSSERTFS